MQPYVFISHSSEDKQERVRPLVQALVWHKIRVWIDRPGHGDSHFGFDQAYIERNGILGLSSGTDYRAQIQSALRNASAVLVCLSKALTAQRQVLVQELTFGAIQDKLVACIVDDVRHADIPSDLGLTDAARLQAYRIVPRELAKAADYMQRHPAGRPEELPEPGRRQWAIAEQLADEIKRILPVTADAATLATLRTALNRIPIGPAVAFYEISTDLVSFIADTNADPERNRQLVRGAMNLRLECNPEGFTAMQVSVGPGEMLNPDRVAPEEFWTDVLARAGAKSRRTLAAVLLYPALAPRAAMSPELSREFDDFVRRLEVPKRSAQSRLMPGR